MRLRKKLRTRLCALGFIVLLGGMTANVIASTSGVIDTLLTYNCITEPSQRCMKLNSRVLSEEKLLAEYFNTINDIDSGLYVTVAEGFLSAPISEREYIDDFVFYSSVIASDPRLRYVLADKASQSTLSQFNRSKADVQKALAKLDIGDVEGASSDLKTVAQNSNSDVEDRFLSLLLLSEFYSDVSSVSIEWIEQEAKKLEATVEQIVDYSNVSVSSLNADKTIDVNDIRSLIAKLKFDAIKG